MVLSTERHDEYLRFLQTGESLVSDISARRKIIDNSLREKLSVDEILRLLVVGDLREEGSGSIVDVKCLLVEAFRRQKTSKFNPFAKSKIVRSAHVIGQGFQYEDDDFKPRYTTDGLVNKIILMIKDKDGDLHPVEGTFKNSSYLVAQNPLDYSRIGDYSHSGYCPMQVLSGGRADELGYGGKVAVVDITNIDTRVPFDDGFYSFDVVKNYGNWANELSGALSPIFEGVESILHLK